MKAPLVSVIILNWNGKKWLKKCLSSLKKIRYPNFEVIVVNNGSTDDSAVFLKKEHPYVHVIEIRNNIGYAAANNRGVQKAKGAYILFLNNDTKLTPDFLEALVSDMESDSSVGAVQPQMRSMMHPELMDSVGSYFTDTGFLYYLGYMKPFTNPVYQTRRYFYSLKGACFLMRKKDYDSLGGFDEDFVCYVEETDLCHRIWLSGKKVLYEPKSIMYHWGGGDMHVMTAGEVNVFRSFRNRIYSYYKNFSMVYFIRILLVHLFMCECYIVAAAMTGRLKHAWYAQKGVFAGLYGIFFMGKKRYTIQKQIRRVGDGAVMPYIRRNPRPEYYFRLITGLQGYEDTNI